MKEGNITHDEVNAAIGKAEKTIVFGRQNRLRDGVLIAEDAQLARFEMNHDQTKFLYSAVRQLPEYFLDALLEKNITITMVQGKALLCFKDVRNHQSIHSGRTRRTIYVPELVLDVAFRNGYDYWSLAYILVNEGWKLLDFILLLEMVEEAKRYVLSHSVAVMGYNRFRRILRARNKHRSWLESEELKSQRKQFNSDIAVSEMEEFIKLYEKPFMKLMRSGADYLYEVGVEDVPANGDPSFVLMSSDAAAKALFDEYREHMWGEKKSKEFFEELNFPDYFLLDRDILHPAAKEMAEMYGQQIEASTIDEARHDYRDTLRFGIGTEIGTEKFVEQAIAFGYEGLAGLVQEIVDYLFAAGRPNEMLKKRMEARLFELSSRPEELEEALDHGMTLARFGQTLRFYTDVRSGTIELHQEDIDFLRGLMVQLAQTKAKSGDTRTQMLLLMNDVEEMADQLKALLLGEAKTLLDKHVTVEQLEPPTVLKESDAELQLAMVRAMLCLDLAPNFQAAIAAMAGRDPAINAILEDFVAMCGRDEKRQVAVTGVQRALDSQRQELGLQGRATTDLHPDHHILGDLQETVSAIQSMLPQRLHGATSDTGTALRKAMRDFDRVRNANPADPDQLGALAMVLVRLDRTENYSELLDQVRGMGDYALGYLIQQGLNSYYTPGLLRVINEVKPGTIRSNALELAEKLSRCQNLARLVSQRTTNANMLESMRERRGLGTDPSAAARDAGGDSI